MMKFSKSNYRNGCTILHLKKNPPQVSFKCSHGVVWELYFNKAVTKGGESPSRINIKHHNEAQSQETGELVLAARQVWLE